MVALCTPTKFWTFVVKRDHLCGSCHILKRIGPSLALLADSMLICGWLISVELLAIDMEVFDFPKITFSLIIIYH